MPGQYTPTFDWNDDAVAALIRLHAAGLSSAQIACEMGGGLTRGAISGKIDRLGLSGRARRIKVQEATWRPARSLSQSATDSHISRRMARPQDRGGGPIQRIQKRIEQQERAPKPAHVPMTDIPPDTSPDAVPFLARAGATCRWPLNGTVPIEAHLVGGSKTDGEHSYCCRHYEISVQAQRRPMSPAELELRRRAGQRRELKDQAAIFGGR